MVGEGAANARARLEEIAMLARQAREFALMDFRFLYNAETDLLTIGYNVSERRLDNSSYDLLASEARLASFVGIAQGQFPQEHWFALGRQLCLVGGEQLLLSWSGSMFEYLMPLLVMPGYRDTLLDQTYHGIIHAQIDYARRRDIPWGVSESGYNTVDASMNYQYRAFGVPGTGLKRGLGDDMVVAPYATMMGLMVEPERPAPTWNAWPGWASPAPTASTRRSTTPPRACRAARTSPWCAPSWRTTRAWASWRCPTCCTTARCSAASRPTRSSRPPCCCCRNACRRPAPSSRQHRGRARCAARRRKRRCRPAC
jgi:hypothetical protein